MESMTSNPNISLDVTYQSGSFLPPFLFQHDTPVRDRNQMDISSGRSPEKYNTSISILPSPLRDYEAEVSVLESKTSNAPGGPPVTALIDYEINQMVSPVFSQNSRADTSSSFQVQRGLRDYSAADENALEYWVTVFGFPSSKTSAVLSYFSRCGNIETVKHPLRGGNWINIKYSLKREADSALSRNAKLIAPNLMVGVIPCIEMGTTDNPSDFTPSVLSMQSPFSSPVQSPSTPKAIRLLKSNSMEQTQSDNTLPQKSEGFLSKAMDYVFGW